MPKAPPSPIPISISSTLLTIQLYPTRDNGGAVVTNYELYRDDGTDNSAFSKITDYTYSTNGFIITLNLATETMVAGRFYQFIYRAVNVIGYSDFSGVRTIPVADLPSAPAAPNKVESQSSRTTITV